MSIQSFTDLEVYKMCRTLRKEVSVLVKNNFPVAEKYRLSDQIIRSSRSVTANISEGFGRFHHQENTQFCRIARGSLYETLEHIITAFDEGYLTKDELIQYKQQVDMCLKLLNGYINHLQKQKNGTSG